MVAFKFVFVPDFSSAANVLPPDSEGMSKLVRASMPDDQARSGWAKIVNYSAEISIPASVGGGGSQKQENSQYHTLSNKNPGMLRLGK